MSNPLHCAKNMKNSPTNMKLTPANMNPTPTYRFPTPTYRFSNPTYRKTCRAACQTCRSALQVRPPARDQSPHPPVRSAPLQDYRPQMPGNPAPIRNAVFRSGILDCPGPMQVLYCPAWNWPPPTTKPRLPNIR